MNSIPPPPNTGEPLAASWGRRVVEALRALVPIAGPGIRVSYTPRGVVIESTASSAPSRASSAQDHPFKCIKADATHLRYVFGIVGNVVPTVAGTPMDELLGTAPGTPPVLAVSSGGVSYLETVWGGASEPYALQSAAVKVGAGVPDDDLTHGYQLLSTHTMINGALDSIAQGVTHSLAVERVACGGGASYYWGAM